MFWSVQGEGTEVGHPSVFVRFGGCDLRCAWCDSVRTWKPAESCRVEREPGSGRFDAWDNPVALGAVVDAVRRLQGDAAGLVSLTGGEPLLQPEAVTELAAALRGQGSRILLETHGLEAEALGRVIDQVDVVSMDWKLASDVRRESDPREGEPPAFHEAHEAFLRVAKTGARDDTELYVKLVVTPASRDDEIRAACERIARTAPDVPLVLQPVTPSGPVREAPSGQRMLELVGLCRQQLADVRLIPQTHKQLGIA